VTRRRELDALLDRHADDLADACLLAGVALIERACSRSRESVDFRWRSYPRGELRALRRSLQQGIALARMGCLMREVDDERWLEREQRRELAQELLDRAAEEGRKRPPS
jgi:hypothetical protein